MRISTTNFQNAFGKYLKYALEDEDVIVTKNGKAVAKLIKYADPLISHLGEKGLEYLVDKRYTYGQFDALRKKSDTHLEFIDGEIFMLASPNHQHQVIVLETIVQLYSYFDGSSCRPLMAPYDVMLYNGASRFEDDPNLVQPDILVIGDQDQVDAKGRYHGTPKLVVEVLSDTTRSKDMLTKLNLYTRSGIDEYWIVDPLHENIIVYQMTDRNIFAVHEYRFGQVIKSQVFDGLSVKSDKFK